MRRLKQLSEAVTGRARIPVKLDIKGTSKLPAEVKIVFHRIAQEALNNITKHSGARNVILELNINEDEQLDITVASLSVTDDGNGFDPGGVTSEHFGLSIMRERAGTVGATLMVSSEIGRGTVIELQWVGEGVNEKGICKKTGRVYVDVNPRYFRPAEVELLWGDCSKAEKELGWKRKVDFPGLVKMMIDADMKEIAGYSIKEFLTKTEAAATK
jgi:hypothetical protein